MAPTSKSQSALAQRRFRLLWKGVRSANGLTATDIDDVEARMQTSMGLLKSQAYISESNTGPTNFMSLPPEIRIRIYEAVVTQVAMVGTTHKRMSTAVAAIPAFTTFGSIACSEVCSLVYVSKVIRKEFLPVLFRNTFFSINHMLRFGCQEGQEGWLMRDIKESSDAQQNDLKGYCNHFQLIKHLSVDLICFRSTSSDHQTHVLGIHIDRRRATLNLTLDGEEVHGTSIEAVTNALVSQGSSVCPGPHSEFDISFPRLLRRLLMRACERLLKEHKPKREDLKTFQKVGECLLPWTRGNGVYC